MSMIKAHDQLAELDVKSCLDGLAALYARAGTNGFFDGLVSFFRQFIPFEIGSIFEFQKGAQPKSLWTCQVGYDADTQVYNRGLYLLDPCFDAYENRNLTGIFHFSREDSENFINNEFYKRYWQHIGIDNEFAGLYPVGRDRCVHLSIMLSNVAPDEIEKILSLLRVLETTCCTLFNLHFDISGNSDLSEIRRRRDFHVEANGIFRNFAKDILTPREHTVLLLFLRGYSTKSIGRQLNISPGTVSIHRSNFYEKLEVSSQGELFALFIEKLLTN